MTNEMKYGVIYEFSKFGNAVQSLSTYRNFKSAPIEGNKAFHESQDAVRVLFLFDSEQERKDFDKEIVLPRWTYTLRLGKKRLEKIYSQFK